MILMIFNCLIKIFHKDEKSKIDGDKLGYFEQRGKGLELNYVTTLVTKYV